MRTEAYLTLSGGVSTAYLDADDYDPEVYRYPGTDKYTDAELVLEWDWERVEWREVPA